MSSNPFAALFNATEAAKQESEDILATAPPQEENVASGDILMNNIIEDVFGFTICENRESPFRQNIPLVYLEESAEDTDHFLTVTLLRTVLFDRLMIENPSQLVIPKNESNNIDSTFIESEVLTYLFHCYERLKKYNNLDETTMENIKSLIFQNAVLFLQQPIVFLEQNGKNQCIKLIRDFEMPCENFLEEITNFYNNEDGNTLYEAFRPVLVDIQKDAVKSRLLTVDPYVFRALEIFTMNDKFADILLEFCTPRDPENGFNYTNTLFGALLSISILPKSFGHNYEFFDNPMDQSSLIIENNLWQGTDNLTQKIFTIIMRLLKLKTARIKILKWISQCLKANAGRGKLWNQQVFNPAFINNVSDGFMMNLANIVLRLCQPFCTNLSDGKILKVDPTYCAVADDDRESKQVNMFGLSSETCLIPTSSDEVRPTSEKYNFVTELFFMTHRTLDLSFRICVDQLVQLNQELSQIQRAYNDAVAQVGGTSPVTDTLKVRMEEGYKKYRSLRAVLIEPGFLMMMSQFHKATTTWIVQVCLNNEFDGSTYAPILYKDIKFPMATEVPDTLKCIPEFVVENTVGYLSFLRRFYPQTLEEQGFEFLNPILTMVITFMGSPERMKNPHLRARMAECLEALLPEHKDFPNTMNPLGKFQREILFKSHEHRMEIVENLLSVFVSIEMTGQSVQFEQKFNYRRPMYVVMDYLWQLEEHKQKFKELAKEAEENINAVTPPLFLRFVNLLMNDAVFLLDESLSNIAQIRTMQTARENGEWNNLPAEERTQNLSYLNHLGMIARFDNILGRETIHTLELLTSEIQIVFTHSTMVDRVAAMLNYFLYNLVGPNKKNFKVKDQKEYEFDPANTVLNICKIYINLVESNSFCLAISQDGRSYSPQLFSLAEDVLVRIGGGILITQVQELAEKVAKLATQQEKEEEILAEAPEEFLDPIMSTLMTDPVILPSSKQIVDRTTIARHILSDQTDPFNREPLTMDQLIPASDLKNKIDSWIREKKNQKPSSSSENL